MTDNGHTPAVPEPAERGRYAIYMQPDGGLLIARRTDLCQTCLDCGCGQQADPVGPIPGTLVAMARAAAEGKVKFPQAIRAAMRRG